MSTAHACLPALGPVEQMDDMVRVQQAVAQSHPNPNHNTNLIECPYAHFDEPVVVVRHWPG
jgi:hypothetical protein